MATYNYKYAVGEEVKIYDGFGTSSFDSFIVKPEYLRSALIVGIKINMEDFKYEVLLYESNKIIILEEKNIFPYDELEKVNYIGENILGEDIPDENEPTQDEIQQSL